MTSAVIRFGRDECVVHHRAAGDQREIRAFAQDLGVAEGEWRCAGRDDRSLVARETDIDRAVTCGDRDGRLLGLETVTRHHDTHVGEDAHQGDVFEHLMRATIGTNRHAGMRADDLHVGVVQADGRADLLPVAAG